METPDGIVSLALGRLNAILAKFSQHQMLANAICLGEQPEDTAELDKLDVEIIDAVNEASGLVYTSLGAIVGRDRASAIFKDLGEIIACLPITGLAGETTERRNVEMNLIEHIAWLHQFNVRIPETETSNSIRPIRSMSKEALALATLAEHPEWSDEEIANAAQCSRTSLYRMPRFKIARAAFRQGNIPRGSKSKTGEMEAYKE